MPIYKSHPGDPPQHNDCSFKFLTPQVSEGRTCDGNDFSANADANIFVTEQPGGTVVFVWWTDGRAIYIFVPRDKRSSLTRHPPQLGLLVKLTGNVAHSLSALAFILHILG